MTFTVFAGSRHIVTAPLEEMLRAVKAKFPHPANASLLIFDDSTGREADFDWRGTADEVVARALPKPGPGRPRLGVTAREVTLLPQHWEWLEAQPNGASATLRRLVDAARKRDDGAAQRTIEAAGRIMTTLAGDRPGFEDALRALYQRDRAAFERHTQRWPAGIRGYLMGRVGPAIQ